MGPNLVPSGDSCYISILGAEPLDIDQEADQSKPGLQRISKEAVPVGGGKGVRFWIFLFGILGEAIMKFCRGEFGSTVEQMLSSLSHCPFSS